MITVLTPNLDGNDASPFKNKMTSFQVLVGGAAELNVHLLNEIKNKQAVTTKLQRTIILVSICMLYRLLLLFSLSY